MGRGTERVENELLKWTVPDVGKVDSGKKTILDKFADDLQETITQIDIVTNFVRGGAHKKVQQKENYLDVKYR